MSDKPDTAHVDSVLLDQAAELPRTAADATDDFAKSLQVGYARIRERVAAGGPRGWLDDTGRKA